LKLRPHLTFSGNCREAFEVYERVLGGKVLSMLSWGDSPAAEQVPVEWREKIVHATLVFGSSELAGADVAEGQYERPQGFAVLVSVATEAEGKRIFDELAQRGRIQMPFQKTFWSSGFGVLVDRFGTPWEVTVEQA
jgi:PhnB protein